MRIGRLFHCAAVVAAVAPAITTAETGPSSLEKAVFASPAPGSAVGLLSEVIKEKKLDERNGLLLDVKYFDPAATEQAVVLRRADAGIFPVVSAARVNLIGEKIRSCSRKDRPPPGWRTSRESGSELWTASR